MRSPYNTVNFRDNIYNRHRKRQAWSTYVGFTFYLIITALCNIMLYCTVLYQNTYYYVVLSTPVHINCVYQNSQIIHYSVSNVEEWFKIKTTTKKRLCNTTRMCLNHTEHCARHQPITTRVSSMTSMMMLMAPIRHGVSNNWRLYCFNSC